MSFDPELFGQAMGEAIRKAVEPLRSEIAALKKQLAEMPAPAAGKDGENGRDGKDGADCDMDAVRAMIDSAVKSIPAPKDGKDGIDGKDGKSITVDDVRPMIDEAIKSMRDEAHQAIDTAIKAIPTPKDGKDGRDGADGKDGERGEKGADGVGLAGAMIDREGSLLVTLTNGEVKSLGPVAGKDGKDGADGKDGISLESFELEYLEETHEIRIKAACGDRVKELRYPAGGLRPAGHWREGVKVAAGEAWTCDGSLWIARSATTAKPDAKSDDWIIAARKGRDGERGPKGKDAEPATPIRLGA